MALYSGRGLAAGDRSHDSGLSRCAAGVKVARQQNFRFGRPPKLTEIGRDGAVVFAALELSVIWRIGARGAPTKTTVLFIPGAPPHPRSKTGLAAVPTAFR